ncbi:MAG: alpha/beta hydrolase [Bacteroidales bacterium]|nr:alpha/beta hydrolase [Bacteroidales bacterium]
MVFLYSAIIAFALLALVLFLIYKGFQTPENPHDQIPKDLGLKIQEIKFPSVKGQDIYAWKVEANPEFPTLILVHGWGRNVERMTPYLRKLCCRGFNMLAFDARGHGNSHKDGPMTMLKFAEDIESAIDAILSNKKQVNKEISLIGLSIGGAASILAARRDKRISKVVTVGAFAHPLEVMRKQLSDRYVPYIPFTWLFFKFMKWRIKIDFDAIAPVNNIKKAKADFLLIHGIDDKVVPLEQAYQLKKAQPNLELWAIPNRGHSNCHLENGFWDKISDFLLNK